MDTSTKDQQVSTHFDSVAEGYAKAYTDGSFFSYFFNRRLEIVFEALKGCDHATILDVGCGPGMMAEYAIERGFEFYGIDISEKMISECTSRFGDSSLAHFSVGKLQTLEFPDNFFDVVLCMGALEYVEQDEILPALAEMSRVLKPNGQIIISLMNKNSFFAWHRRVRGSILKRFTKRTDYAESYDDLTRPFDQSSILESLRLKKFKDVSIICFGLNIYPYFLEWRIPTEWRIKISRSLETIVKGKFKWPYMAFIVKAKK
jgi:ubiquinone/menaquinone biosynthesis C-methylase UbiE